MQDPWRAGATIGDHVLMRRLGAGGMGAVDLARHATTGALHAIKSMRPGAEPGAIVRFQREAEALGALGPHPGIVRVHGTGVEHGRPYVVMEHLAGGDLEARAARPLPAAAVVRLGVALARALQHAHERGVLHRDLKPQNVLFDGPGAHARPVLADFGLARLATGDALTRTGELLGTPVYMAPEQVHGDRRAQGPATDVFGLGGVLYRALTARPPAHGQTVMEVLTCVLAGPPPPADTVVPDVPAALSRALERALARRPADRFSSAAAFADALEAVAARPALARARVLPAALAVVGAALVVALVAAVLLSAPPPARPRPAPPPREAPRPAPTPAPARAPVAPVGPARAESLPRAVAELGEPGPRTFALLPREVAMVELASDESLALCEALVESARRPDCPDKAAREAYTARLLARIARAGTLESPRAWLFLVDVFSDGRGVTRSTAEAGRCLEAGAATGSDELRARVLLARVEGALGLPPIDLRKARAEARALLDADPGPATRALDIVRHALALVAELDPSVVTSEEGAALLAQIEEPGTPLMLLRARLLLRFHPEGAAREAWRLISRADPDDPAEVERIAEARRILSVVDTGPR